MNLEDVRREMRERGGAIKAWALRPDTFKSILAELGVQGVEPSGMAHGAIPAECKLFEFPVVFVYTFQPEGVIA